MQGDKRGIGRRRFVSGVCGALGLFGVGFVALPGCGVYAAEEGEAFSPWDFPGGEASPERLVARAALLAASPHNTQPWGISIGEGRLGVRARLDRHLGAMDPLRRELHVGLGCAVENMVVAASAVGRRADVVWLPRSEDPALVAEVTLVPGAPRSPYVDAIARRHTNRGAYLDVPFPRELEGMLRALSDDPVVGLHVVSSPEDRARFREETVRATEAIVADAEMLAASDAWYRHSADEIAANRDGVTLDATGNGALTRTFGKAFARPSAETAASYWLDSTRTSHTTGSAFVVLSTPAPSTREAELRAGRIYQRMHLAATLEGLAMQPLNQLAERQDREEERGLPARFGGYLESVVGRGRRAQMIFRIGYAWDDAAKSPRRPLEWVLA